MTGYDKIKEYVSTEPLISNDVASDLIEFINEVSEQEKVVNVPQADSVQPLLSEVRALGEAICDMEKYISDESSMLGEKYKKVVEKYNKVSEHFI